MKAAEPVKTGRNNGLPLAFDLPVADAGTPVEFPMSSFSPSKQWENLANREAVIEFNEPSPILVVEVVSKSTQTTDYRRKRSEYAVLAIPEYWIVDPLQDLVTVCALEEGFYEAIEFRGKNGSCRRRFPSWR